MSYHKLILKNIKFCGSCIEIGKQKMKILKGESTDNLVSRLRVTFIRRVYNLGLYMIKVRIFIYFMFSKTFI